MRRNYLLNQDITRTEDENIDDIFLRSINEHLEVDLTENEVDRTHRTGNSKLGNKRPIPIIVKFKR